MKDILCLLMKNKECKHQTSTEASILQCTNCHDISTLLSSKWQMHLAGVYAYA